MSTSRPAATWRLRPGLRVSRRGPGQLQVGLHAEDRVVLPDTPEVRRLLRDLRHGVRTAVVPAELVAVLDALHQRGVVTGSPEHSGVVRVGVVAPDAVRALAHRLLATAGLEVTTGRREPSVVLVVSTGAEPRRDDLDRWMREDRPHLLLTTLGGRTRLGPLVVPGVTACLRCVDEHAADRDPRHPLVLEQHLAPDPEDLPSPPALQLALAWAAHDLACWTSGRQPATWSATIELAAAAHGGSGPSAPTAQAWRRHPRCGCAWGDALVHDLRGDLTG